MSAHSLEHRFLLERIIATLLKLLRTRKLYSDTREIFDSHKTEVAMGEKKLDLKTLEGQTNLTDEQADLVAKEAIAEAEAEEKKVAGKEDELPKEVQEEIAAAKKKEEEAAAKEKGELTGDELLVAKDEALTVEQKTQKAELVKKKEEDKTKEEERLLSAKDEDLNAEDKTKKVEVVKVRGEAKNKTVQEEIKAYATELGVSEEEAKEDLEHITKIQEKYKDDPKQLAKANLHIQRLYTRTQEELKTLKTPAPPREATLEGVTKWMEDGNVTDPKGNKLSKEQIIQAYREVNSDLEALDDEAIFVRAAKEYQAVINKSIAEAQTQLGPKAKEKREKILTSLSEEDKRFLPTVKPLIEKLSDAQVMDDKFNIQTYVTYAKGEIFDATLERLEKEKKEIGEKEFKRGLEEAKILGEKKPPDGKPPVSKGTSLTVAQKTRAREMFDSPEITEEQAYKLYQDYLKESGAEF